MSDSYVQTVLGRIDPETMGHTQTHEHLLCDLWAGVPPRATASDRARYLEPVRLSNRYWNRRNHGQDDMQLLSIDDAVSEALAFRAAGGGTVVDVTPICLARDPVGLATIARMTGVNIVMGCGYYTQPYHSPSLSDRSESDIAEEMIRDITEGVGDTSIRAGIIGEIGMGWPVHPDEEKVLRASAVAQRETGVGLSIHPSRGNPNATFDHIQVLEDAKADMSKVVMGHIDRALFDIPAMLRLANTGCTLAFDLFGREDSYYSFGGERTDHSLDRAIDMPNDAIRIGYIMALIDAGFHDNIVISQDMCRKTHMEKYGGEGLGHILKHVLPTMRRKGISAELIDRIVCENPKRLLAVRA
jgi:phosphotriesterase-related protein